MSLPSAILNELAKVEPAATFSGRLGGRVKSSNENLYFVKSGSSDEAEQYTGETDSLKAINTGAPEYKDIGHLTEKGASKLAKRLAIELHTYRSRDGFGFKVPTYCGATRMKNGWYDSWEQCYSEMIGDLLVILEKRGRYQELCTKGQSIRKEVIPKLLGPLRVEPVLLHGDLWSGNVGVDSATGEPVILTRRHSLGTTKRITEPSLAIARIFGGFPPSFFGEYHKHLPKAKPESQYELRGHLYELFHYLNHTVLFGGGGYESSALRKMDLLMNAMQNHERESA
ncbi:fructosamine kinase [Lentinula guzmanii]|uniref:protein-ribulosamine 3-kinase n=1 Tax=Lentinula guzmanii TaxID=2804957 RepID=A0AA38N091_9AGAR|nr:fructosamine kinase [Lentinula guzmanii]